jgi:Na+/proline symporter
MGLILNVVVGLEIWQGIVISAIIVTFYTYIGGMWAISVTDFIQSIIIVVGLLLLAITLSKEAGGVFNVLKDVPSESFRFLPTPNFKEIVKYFAAWFVLGLGSIPSQDVFQRVMSSGSVSTAVRSCFIAAGLYLTVAMLPLFISLCTKHLYPEQLVGDAQLTLPNMVLAHASMPIQILFFGSLLSAIMSTTSSAILAPAAIFSENLAKPIMKDKLTDIQLLKVTRISILGFSILATVMACVRSNIYQLVGESSVLSLVSLFAPMALGLYWKKASSGGALLSMFTGMLTWVIFEASKTSWPSLVPALIVSLLAMVLGSLVWPTTKSND